jgi:hypothetical protein
MWRWDQGRLNYFQFDAMRLISKFIIKHDFKNADRAVLTQITGFDFKPATYTPWRNYARVVKLCLLASERDGKAVATLLAKLLATDGAITCDEYLHFLAQASTDPSPAMEGYSSAAAFRYPLLVALKYLLTKRATKISNSATLNELIEVYGKTKLTGEEDQTSFINAVSKRYDGASLPKTDLVRQAKESLLVLSQISYLHCHAGRIIISLDPEDALELFNDLHPIVGPFSDDPDLEIQRRASLFSGVATEFEYSHTVISDAVESGFSEGTKVEKTHVIIERNSQLRAEFFRVKPTSECDVCKLLTDKTYSWADRILDLHHLLPLSSGTRMNARGTMLDDLVPVCPSCHRAVHRFYSVWLKKQKQRDFLNKEEAVHVYNTIKGKFKGAKYA